MYCIYRITNLINGKTYIGQHKYKKLDDNYMGGGNLLKADQEKYGIENFKKEILIFNISKKEHIDLLEKTFIASERNKVGTENCYNIREGGGSGGYLNHLSGMTKIDILERIESRLLMRSKRKNKDIIDVAETKEEKFVAIYIAEVKKLRNELLEKL